jgi:hypothetical protein
LLPGARHEISAELRAVRTFKTGKRRYTIRQNSIDVRDVHASHAGKRIARATITCGE